MESQTVPFFFLFEIFILKLNRDHVLMINGNVVIIQMETNLRTGIYTSGYINSSKQNPRAAASNRPSKRTNTTG